MKVEFGRLLCPIFGSHVYYDGVTRIVSAGESCADIDVGSKDIDQLLFIHRSNECRSVFVGCRVTGKAENVCTVCESAASATTASQEVANVVVLPCPCLRPPLK